MSESAEIQIARLEVEHKALGQRLEVAESRLKDITDIMMTIQHLSESVQQVANSVESMNKRLTVIEQVPAEKWNTMTKTIFTAFLGAAGGCLATVLFQVVTQFAQLG